MLKRLEIQTAKHIYSQLGTNFNVISSHLLHKFPL